MVDDADDGVTDTPRWAFGLVSVFEVLTCLGLTMMVVGALLPALAYAR